LIATHQKTLEQADQDVDLLRAQGAVSVLRKIKRLRDEVSDLDG